MMYKATTLLLGACLAWSAQAQAQERVVSLGGSVTEIVYALGQGERVVGDDLSSLYPEAATKVPRVGYYRAVPVEGVLGSVMLAGFDGPSQTLAPNSAAAYFPLKSFKERGELGVGEALVKHPLIRAVGRDYDRRLFTASNGVNTQRGALFALGHGAAVVLMVAAMGADGFSHVASVTVDGVVYQYDSASTERISRCDAAKAGPMGARLSKVIHEKKAPM